MTRRILFCTIGGTAQIVTETVWALREKRNWIPDEIQIVTTTEALNTLREEFQTATGHLARMFAESPPPVVISVPCIDGTLLSLRAGDSPSAESLSSALRDVNSVEQASVMGTAILRLMAGFAADETSEIHVSLAGGRKTMSAHALLALALVGRTCDEASHVLVSPEYESNSAFWHPKQVEPVPSKKSPHLSLDPKDADVTLVPTPTPLLRYEVKHIDKVIGRGLQQAIADVNLGRILVTNPSVRLNVEANTVSLCGIERTLSPKFFATFRLLLEAKRDRWPGVGPDGAGPDHQGWLSPSAICDNKTPDGECIDIVYLEYLQEAAKIAEISKPDAEQGVKPEVESEKSVIAWTRLVEEKERAKRVKSAKTLWAPTNFLNELENLFGAPAVDSLIGRHSGRRDEAPSRVGIIVSSNALHE